jgi:hypothetical protein
MTEHGTRAVASLAVCCVLLMAAPALAQVVALSGPGDFSGGETTIDFEDPNLFDGMAVAQFGDVTLGLEDEAGNDFGGAAFGLATEPREFGSPAPGSVNNYGVVGLPFPFPMLRLGLPGVAHRVAFEVRANELDEVVVTFLLGGAVVGQATQPSPTSGTFHFHGFEVAGGFDEVLVDATENFTGAFALDNLMYETLAGAPDPDPGDDPPPDPEPDPEPDPGPVADVPVYQCEGFYSLDEAAGHRDGHMRRAAKAFLRHLPFKLLRASLSDDHGVRLAWHDLAAAPVVKVLHEAEGDEETHDVTSEAVFRDSAAFHYRHGGVWLKMLRRSALDEPGTYVVTLESGDPEEYAVDSCVEWIVVEPPGKSGNDHHWMHRWHRRFGGHD